jgi:hypothetical protein
MHSTTDSKSNHYTRFFSIPHLFKISHQPNLQSSTNTRIVKGHHTCCSMNLSILAMLNFVRFNSDGGHGLSCHSMSGLMLLIHGNLEISPGRSLWLAENPSTHLLTSTIRYWNLSKLAFLINGYVQVYQWPVCWSTIVDT